MGLTMVERKAVIATVAPRYQKATKKGRGAILDEFVQMTGYHRVYAAWVLRTHGRKIRLSPRLTVVPDAVRLVRRARSRRYGERVVTALRRIWVIMDCICSKRLQPALPELIDVLERHGELRLDWNTKKDLLQISTATIDRLLAPERKKFALRQRSRTKPGTLLKHQIAVRTFAEWDEKRPGFVEIDLVAHDGGDGRGDFIQSLDVTDVLSAWTETQAIENKAQVWVFEALQQIRARLPFPLRGIDSDNGSEFINHHLYRYCRQQRITFTRARSYRKNDSCYVEQKNYSVVRRAVGYGRYDTPRHLAVLNELYASLRLYTNYFQPVMKQVEKVRVGSRVRKKYDRARTPYQRLLDSPAVPKTSKQKLRAPYATLNPAALKRQIQKLQEQLALLPTKEKERINRQWRDEAGKKPRRSRPGGAKNGASVHKDF